MSFKHGGRDVFGVSKSSLKKAVAKTLKISLFPFFFPEIEKGEDVQNVHFNSSNTGL